MTPEQRKRIRAAARELASAMTEAGDQFEVEVCRSDVTAMISERRQYVYAVTVEATTREVIA